MLECNQNRAKCQFRTKLNFCGAETGRCTPVVEECRSAGLKLKEGGALPCSKIVGELCAVYLYPSKKWETACPMRSMSTAPAGDGKMINPLKASKKAAKKH